MSKICSIMSSIKKLFWSSTSAELPSLGKYPKMFKSAEYTLTMLRLGDEAEKTFLIKVDGIDNDFDGQIFKHEVKCNDTRCSSYKLETKEIPGKDRWWTVQSTQSWGNHQGLILYPPGINKKSDLHQTESPQEFDAIAFYKTYLLQQSTR